MSLVILSYTINYVHEVESTTIIDMLGKQPASQAKVR